MIRYSKREVTVYHYSMHKYGKENAEEHMKKEIDRIA